MAKDWWEESALESAAPKNESADEWWRGAKLENAPKRTWGEAIKDTGAQLAEGVNTTLGAIPSVVAPQSRAAGFFRDNAQYWRDQQSDVLKDRIAASDQRIQEAGKDGVLSQIGTAASEYWNDPAQAARLVATNLPSMAATLGTGAVAGLAAKGVAAARGLDAANKAALAAKYGTTTAAATNAALNAGGARGEAFEDLQKAAIAQGMTPEQAEQAGVSGSILPGVVGGVAGAISGKIGLEKAILGQATTGAAMRKAAGAFGAELAGEQIEELAPKVATNYQVGRIDPGRTLTDDLGRTMVETAIGSGPGAVVAGGASAMRTGETPPPPGAGEPTTSPGAADPNAPQRPLAAPPEAPDLTTSPGAGVARDGIDFTLDVDTSGLSLQDPAELARQRAATVDYQPGDTTPQWDTQPGAAAPRTGLDMPAPEFDTGSLGIDNRTPSERMGLDPAKGSLTRIAALAVDTGASPVQFLGATGRDLVPRRTGPGVTDDSNVIDVQGRVVEDRAIGTPRRLTAQESAYESGAQAFRDGAPRAEIVATQNVVARAHQLRGYDDAARQASTPALPAPSNLREGLERIRAQKQEAANAQAATPEAAPATTTVSAARPGAVEADGPAADVKTITAKQIPDMTDVELQQAIAHYGPTHNRTAKLQKEVQRRAAQTTQGSTNATQTAQAQQASPQPAQAGAAPAEAPGQASPTAPAGASTVRALSDGTPTQNPGAQAAPAAGAQGAAQAAQAGVAPRPKNWRTSMLGAVPVAKAMGIDTKGKRLAQVVAEIDARDTQTPATPAPAPQPGPVRIGRNNTPLSEGGKPFKTRKAAGDAKKLHPMMRVVTVPGGYALAEKTPAQLAAEERASRRLRNPNTSARGEPIPAHAFIAAAGGLNRVAASDMGVDGNPRIGNRTLFAGQGRGLSMDQATQMLIQDGYLIEGATINDALNLIKTSLTRPQYNADGIERIAQAESDAQFEDYLAAQEEAAADGDTDPFGMADEFTAEELDEVGYTSADPALQAEVSALIAQAEASGIDTYAILEDIARTYANATQDQYNAAARDALAQAITRSNQDGGSTAAQAAPASESSAEQGLDPTPALELASQTPAEWQTDSASERFSVGSSLTKEQRRQVLASLVDAYKAKGAQREFKGLDGNGNERYGYTYSPDLFEKSDITGAMVRYYVTLPDGRIAHPSELFPDVSASDIERMALEQDAKRRRLEAFENAIKPFYSDFDSANLMAVRGQVVIKKSGRFAIIPERTGAIGQARQNGWELASPSGQVSEQSAGTRAGREQQDGLTSYTAEEAAQRQEEAAQAAKAEAARQRAADAQAARDEERKRIAQASVRAADTFELGQDPLDSLTGQGSIFDAPEPAPAPQPIARADVAAAQQQARADNRKKVETKEDDTGNVVMFSFAGARAATADTMALATAQERLESGEDAETIRKETGWHKGADGKWRFEISDADAVLMADTSGSEGRRSIGQMFRLFDYEDMGGLTVGRMLHHPALFAAYPEIANIRVEMAADVTGAGYRGGYSVANGRITINRDLSWREAMSTLLHEIQHGIQEVEGFATGSNPSRETDVSEFSEESRKHMQQLVHVDELAREHQVKPTSFVELAGYPDNVVATVKRWAEVGQWESNIAAIKRDLLTAREKYRRSAGEVEARNTQARQNLTDAERRATPPSSTADVADSDVIVTFNGKEMHNAPTPANATPARPSESPLVSAWTALAGQGDIARSPVSRASDLPQVFSEVAPGFVVERQSPTSEMDAAWKIYPEGKPDAHGFVLAYKDGRVELNVPRLSEGDGGAQAYVATGNWALNTGRRFAADRYGLSSLGAARRLENLASMAVKFGTAEFMDMGGNKLGVQWTDNDQQNMENLLRAAYDRVRQAVPDIDKVVYDFETRQFISQAQDVDGVRQSDDPIAALVDQARAAGLPAGRATVSRAVLTGTFIRGEGLHAALRAPGGEAVADNLKGVLYGRGAAPRKTGATTSTIADAIQRAYGNVLPRLQANGLVTLVQSQDDAIEAAAKARAAKTGESLETVRERLMASVRNSIAVWHGSPHRGIEKTGFKLNKIGSGEGAQAYGWGMYFASLRGVAEHYQKALEYNDDDTQDLAESFIDRADGSERQAARDLRHAAANESSAELKQRHLDAADWIDAGKKKKNPSQLYSLNLPVEESDLLDWDRPLSEQSQNVRDAMIPVARMLYPRKDIYSDDDLLSRTGEFIYKGLSGYRNGGPKAASSRLQAAGVPGIRYLDGNSRSNGNGSHNYVIWDEALMTPEAAGIEAKFSKNGAIQGFFDPQTGQSFLVADNLSAEAAPGVLMHEVGIHMAADGSMKALFNRAAMMLKMQRGNPFMKAVQARMDAAGETSGEEAAAYIAEAYENDRANAPASVQRWLADLLAAVKAWMFKKGIMGADRLTVADIAAVARANARSMARDGGATGGQGFGPVFSRAPAGDQTQTEAFKRWFKGSKAVDADGKPLRVYHGTAKDFSEFDVSRAGQSTGNTGFYGAGAYFTQNTGDAAGYAGWAQRTEEDAPNLIPAYLSIQRPVYVHLNPKTEAHRARSRDTISALVDTLESEGFFGQAASANEAGSELARLRSFIEKADYERAMGTLHRLLNGGQGVSDLAQRAGFDGVLVYATKDGRESLEEAVAFRPEQVKSAIGNNGNFDPNNPDIRFSRAGVNTGGQAATGWDAPVPTGFDDVIYKLQDKNIDLKRVVEAITKATGQVADSINAYLKEELFHKRVAKRVADFGARELKPLMNQMRLAGLSMEDVEEYLHARHAKEANAVIAQRNPGNAGLQDGGSGMTNAAADNYFAKLDPAQRRKLESVAAKVDAIIADTRKLYVDYGLEDQAVVDGWANMYQHYIPLMREDKDGGMGTGQGFSVKGRETKGRTGSTRKVVDILANVAMQREKLIVRGEKNIVAQALVGLAQANPNPDFWEVRSQAPTERVFDPKTGVVVERPDPLFKSRENVAVAKVKDANGKVTEQMVVFNEDNPRAVRMAAAMKNLDAGNLEGLLGMSAKVTRYFSAINTQYNPVFGVVNLVRDVQGAMVNLAATPLAGQQGKIARDTVSALSGIYSDIRKTRKGGQASSKWAQLWEQMQEDGGTTGYRELFTTSADRANNLKSILNPEGWMDSKWGKFFTADGRLRVPMSMAQKGATEIFGWLSDYNEAMENGVRLAAYKAALDKGMSREQAASLAKNLTVNFNRKGQVGQQAGAVYAFFNAAMQGTARIGQTLFDMDGGDISTLRLSKTGKAVVYGGVTLGAIQALALAAAGFDAEDPPEFVRERSLIIPTGGKTYVSIPMPLGLHVIPGIGRHATEFALSGFDKPAKRALSVIGMFADAFNPVGNAGLSMQTLAPTALDPLVALTENKDWTGKPIARVSFNKALPGHTQWKDTATWYSKMAAEAINWVSGGNEYVAGALSPTPDQIDYLVAQVGGGVAREASKVFQAASTTVNGEELPTYKIPLLGRFAGNAASQASQGTAFYANLDRLNALETEIKGLRKDGRFDEAAKLIRENPQAIMIQMANRAERDVQRLRREKRELIAKDASREEVRAKDEQITAVMMRLNQAAERRKAVSQ